MFSLRLTPAIPYRHNLQREKSRASSCNAIIHGISFRGFNTVRFFNANGHLYERLIQT